MRTDLDVSGYRLGYTWVQIWIHLCTDLETFGYEVLRAHASRCCCNSEGKALLVWELVVPRVGWIIVVAHGAKDLKDVLVSDSFACAWVEACLGYYCLLYTSDAADE